MSDEATIYFESHITIAPVFDERREEASKIAQEFGFKLAKLLMRKNSNDAYILNTDDTFMTGHSKSLSDISQRTISLSNKLHEEGFKVYRYKIEDTIIDSRHKDEFKLIKKDYPWK